MRVTNTMLANQTIDRLQNLSTMISDSTAQVSSGTRINAVSDDPAAGADLLLIDSNLKAYNQYQRNLDDAHTRATTEDSVLSDLSNMLDRARQIGTEQDVATMTATDRAAAKAEVDSIIQSAVQLANTKNGQGYLFAENVTGTSAPFVNTPPFITTATNPSGAHMAEVGPGRLLPTNHNGTQLFLSTNVLQSLTDLSNALGANNQTQIETALQSVTQAGDNVQVLVGEHGGRMAALDAADNDLSVLKADAQQRRSKVADVDMSVAMTEFSARQTAYQAALVATSKVLSLSLTDFLR